MKNADAQQKMRGVAATCDEKLAQWLEQASARRRDCCVAASPSCRSSAGQAGDQFAVMSETRRKLPR
jgi:hypothetical protein